jgi:hypothetical protein
LCRLVNSKSKENEPTSTSYLITRPFVYAFLPLLSLVQNPCTLISSENNETLATNKTIPNVNQSISIASASQQNLPLTSSYVTKGTTEGTGPLPALVVRHQRRATRLPITHCGQRASQRALELATSGRRRLCHRIWGHRHLGCRCLGRCRRR